MKIMGAPSIEALGEATMESLLVKLRGGRAERFVVARLDSRDPSEFRHTQELMHRHIIFFFGP